MFGFPWFNRRKSARRVDDQQAQAREATAHKLATMKELSEKIKMSCGADDKRHHSLPVTFERRHA